MALTATTTNDTMTEITHTLGMYKCTEIKASSNRPNIMYNVKKMKNVPEEEIEQRQELLDEIFGEVVNNLQNNGKKAPKAIVFCFLRNDCAIIYEYFLQKLGKQNMALFNMFTNVTDDATKKAIVSQFCSLESELRVVIATVAFGMGINCPDVVKIIHYRAPSNLLNYGQESGRCGRDGTQAVAQLYYSNKEFGVCSSKFNKKKSKYQSEICDLEKMKCYVTNTSECRRFLLLSYFDGEDDAKKEIQSQETIKHNCCDICASTCECEDCLLMEAMDAMEIDKYDENSVFPQVESECHKFNIEQKKVIEKQLVDLRESISQNACLLSADHSLGFTTQVVKQIVESCDSMITVEHVLDKADIWDATLAQKVLDILENVAK